ncbi:hypothetical protein EYC80_007872 [Monilinia laxa]|uniref:Uncharacterized protein n=1 Tax=Monilinia laxa TaxID=61186 RepID=A0A5N6JSS6_MONLA|nr:hypothetical protein EYC80_007872 [Monilinia laxa]
MSANCAENEQRPKILSKIQKAVKKLRNMRSGPGLTERTYMELASSEGEEPASGNSEAYPRIISGRMMKTLFEHKASCSRCVPFTLLVNLGECESMRALVSTHQSHAEDNSKKPLPGANMVNKLKLHPHHIKGMCSTYREIKNELAVEKNEFCDGHKVGQEPALSSMRTTRTETNSKSQGESWSSGEVQGTSSTKNRLTRKGILYTLPSVGMLCHSDIPVITWAENSGPGRGQTPDLLCIIKFHIPGFCLQESAVFAMIRDSHPDTRYLQFQVADDASERVDSDVCYIHWEQKDLVDQLIKKLHGSTVMGKYGRMEFKISITKEYYRRNGKALVFDHWFQSFSDL